MLDIVETFIAVTTLYGVTFLATLTLFIFTVRNVHVRRDPARKAFLWLKAAMAMFTITCAFETSNLSLVTARYYGHWRDWRAYFAFNILTPLAMSFTDALILMLLVHAISGIVLVHNGHTGRPEKVMVGGSYFIVTVIVAFALTRFGFRIREYFDYLPYPQALQAYHGVSMTLWAVVLIASLIILARSAQLMAKCRPEPRTAKAAIFVFSGSLLWFTRAIYLLIVTAAQGMLRAPLHLLITEYVFAAFPVFVLFCVLYGLGVKREDGLWSISHPFAKLDAGGQQSVGPTNPDNSANSGTGGVLA